MSLLIRRRMTLSKNEEESGLTVLFNNGVFSDLCGEFVALGLKAQAEKTSMGVNTETGNYVMTCDTGSSSNVTNTATLEKRLVGFGGKTVHVIGSFDKLTSHSANGNMSLYLSENVVDSSSSQTSFENASYVSNSTTGAFDLSITIPTAFNPFLSVTFSQWGNARKRVVISKIYIE